MENIHSSLKAKRQSPFDVYVNSGIMSNESISMRRSSRTISIIKESTRHIMKGCVRGKIIVPINWWDDNAVIHRIYGKCEQSMYEKTLHQVSKGQKLPCTTEKYPESNSFKLETYSRIERYKKLNKYRRIEHHRKVETYKWIEKYKNRLVNEEKYLSANFGTDESEDKETLGVCKYPRRKAVEEKKSHTAPTSSLGHQPNQNSLLNEGQRNQFYINTEWSRQSVLSSKLPCKSSIRTTKTTSSLPSSRYVSVTSDLSPIWARRCFPASIRLPAPRFKDGEFCYLCKSFFSVFRRRHHCRMCAGIVCNKCSPHKAPIPEYGYDTLERHCRRCWNK